MILQQLLGEIPAKTFVDDSFCKFPFSLRGAATAFIPLATWETVRTVLQRPNPDIILSRQGERWDEQSHPSLETVQSLHQQGFTLMVRDSQDQDPGLKELAEQFHAAFAAPIDVQLYYTPADQHGFGWHYDAEDVFLLQTAGSKEYSLRKNTVNPWPLKETLPSNMRYEREIMPMMKCRLEAGDWLYIPAGYWHRAEAFDDSITIAVGVLTTAALDVFDFLRSRLLDSLMWRQRLPFFGTACELTPEEQLARCQEIVTQLAGDLREQLLDPEFIKSFAKSREV